MIYPCNCTHNGGEQCYNCLNGAHSICSANKKCDKETGNHVGLRIVIKNKMITHPMKKER